MGAVARSSLFSYSARFKTACWCIPFQNKDHIDLYWLSSLHTCFVLELGLERSMFRTGFHWACTDMSGLDIGACRLSVDWYVYTQFYMFQDVCGGIAGCWLV